MILVRGSSQQRWELRGPWVSQRSNRQQDWPCKRLEYMNTNTGPGEIDKRVGEGDTVGTEMNRERNPC